MPVTRTRRAALAAFLTVAPFFADLGRAQVPEGSAVVATSYNPSVPGTPGLFLVPLAGGPVTRVANLPPALRYTGPGPARGAASVSYRCSDGAIIVGTQNAQAGGAVELYVLYLNGTAVDPARTRQILLGTVGNQGGCWNAVLPDGRILVAAGQQGGPLATGPMAGHALAMVDTTVSPPAFTLLPNPPAAGAAGGFALDPTGRFAWVPVTLNLNTPPSTTQLHRLELATGQMCQVASWFGEVAFGVTCDDDETVYVSATDPTAATHYVHAVATNGCSAGAVTTWQSSMPLFPRGIELDRASGAFVAASANNFLGLPGFAGPQLNALSLITPGPGGVGTVTVVAQAPPGGWGQIGVQGVAVNNRIESYGAPSPGQNRYWFDNFPNPGGQPTLGSLGFSLTMASAPGSAAASALALSFGRGSLNLLGIEILVDLNSTVLQFVPPGPSVTLPLPIPNNAGLSGLVITAQSLHVEAGNGLAASRGLTFTVQ